MFCFSSYKQYQTIPIGFAYYLPIAGRNRWILAFAKDIITLWNMNRIVQDVNSICQVDFLWQSLDYTYIFAVRLFGKWLIFIIHLNWLLFSKQTNYEGQLKSSLSNTFIECDKMRFTFQHYHLLVVHTLLPLVLQCFDSIGQKVINSRYVKWTFQPTLVKYKFYG